MRRTAVCTNLVQIIDDIPVFGEPVDAGALEQIKNAKKLADKVALLADHHLGFGVPIGGVVAYRDHVSPSGVGYDIGCGNKAVRLDVPARKVRAQIHRIMDDVAKKISFGLAQKNQEEVDHPLFEDKAWQEIPVLKRTYDKARNQLGTVGGGNHYVDIFVDEAEQVWVGVHFGSRGLGHTIATEYIEVSRAKGQEADGIATLYARSDAGEEYLEAMRVAGEYAYAGRDWVCERVAKICGGKIVEEVHNHHNYCWRETHGGVDYWVVRKGATPAFPGQMGFVGGSMAEPAVIIRGLDHPLAEHTLHSTVHGAGRQMSRRAAKGDKKKGIQGRVSPHAMQRAMQEANVVLRGGDVDESMHVYKRLPEVLSHHAGTIDIVHTLTPLGVAMAGSDVFDPYRD